MANKKKMKVYKLTDLEKSILFWLSDLRVI